MRYIGVLVRIFLNNFVGNGARGRIAAHERQGTQNVNFADTCTRRA